MNSKCEKGKKELERSDGREELDCDFFRFFSFEMRDFSWMMWLTMLSHALNVDDNDCRLDMYECVLGGDQADAIVEMYLFVTRFQ